ncbi:MAG: LuxR-family transcriptional regulator [Subtercola sp.]|nr:LuxR-family transcriptional regulator [Subtercola sp.]
MVSLVGRDSERAVIAGVMSAASGSQRVLLLRGVSGVGKSALLQGAVEDARALGALIFRSTGVQTESGIDYSALHQLVQPIMRAVGEYPAEWADDLKQTFEPVGDKPVTAFALSNAVLGILDRAAARSRVLLVIDDVQWIDGASGVMLAFLVRRIVNPAVTVIVALRSGFDSPLAVAGLDELVIEPLSAAHSLELLDRAPGTLDAATRQHLLAESAGNPLALVELPKTLTAGQRNGDDSLDENRNLSERLEKVFGARLGELSENSRWLLLLCALDRSGRVATIKRAAGDSWWFADLVAAHEAGVLEVDGDLVGFRHPLARSAVVQGASRDNQRRANRHLAEALIDEPEAWAWHSAAASKGPDAAVADALAAMARRAFINGDSRGALRVILKAIDLTPGGEVREQRSARASFLATVSGQTDVARRILPFRSKTHVFGNTNGYLDESEGYIAASMAYWLLVQDGDVGGASTLLLQALRGTGNVTDQWVLELFDLFVLLCVRTGRADLWEQLNGVLSELGPDAPESVVMTRDALGDPARTAHRFANRARAFREKSRDLSPWQLTWVAACAVYVDDLPSWRSELNRVVTEEELGGSLASFMTALVLSSLDGLASGEWQSSREHAERGLETAGRLSFWANVGDYRSILATISARQGDYEAASAELAQVREWALPHGFRHNRAWALYAEAQVEMAQNNYDEAYGLLIEISPAGRLAPFQPVALMAFMETVTAAWKSGRHDEARQHLAAGHAAHLEQVSPRLAFHLAASDAIVSDSSVKNALFLDALTLNGLSEWPFDEARIRLFYGSWLRSEGDLAAARIQLRAASRVFDRLGAFPWRERAAEEIAKAAEPETGDSPAGVFALLTPQETRIAILAAEGRSNRDIAAVLFLSPRTVASHLYKIFPKVGVTSRAALHQKLSAG